MPDWDRIGTIALGDDVTVRRVGFGGVRLTGPGTFGPPPDLDAGGEWADHVASQS